MKKKTYLNSIYSYLDSEISSFVTADCRALEAIRCILQAWKRRLFIKDFCAKASPSMMLNVQFRAMTTL
jgi:hypothetical protein